MDEDPGLARSVAGGAVIRVLVFVGPGPHPRMETHAIRQGENMTLDFSKRPLDDVTKIVIQNELPEPVAHACPEVGVDEAIEIIRRYVDRTREEE